METRNIADGISVSGQITADDVREIARRGFRTLVSNRPDTEPGTVPHDEIRAAAEAEGLAFHYIPVVSGQWSPQDVEEMAMVMSQCERPILAYCRSGARSASLCNLALVQPQDRTKPRDA